MSQIWLQHRHIRPYRKFSLKSALKKLCMMVTPFQPTYQVV